jgi:hypothetical protein
MLRVDSEIGSAKSRKASDSEGEYREHESDVDKVQELREGHETNKDDDRRFSKGNKAARPARGEGGLGCAEMKGKGWWERGKCEMAPLCEASKVLVG